MSFFSIQYVLLLFFFNLIKSFPSNFINIPVGVTSKKNIIPITIGAIKLPNKIPNLNQALFKGVSNLELNSPKTRKIIEVQSVKSEVLSKEKNIGYIRLKTDRKNIT